MTSTTTANAKPKITPVITLPPAQPQLRATSHTAATSALLRHLAKLAAMAVLVVGMALPGNASTPVTTCQNITGATDDYYLQNDIGSTGVSVCLEITTAYTGTINFYCQGHTITAADWPFKLYGSNAHVYMHGCSYVSGSGGGHILFDCNGLDTWSDAEYFTLHGGYVKVENCYNPYLTGGTYTTTPLYLNVFHGGCSGAVIFGNTIDISAAAIGYAIFTRCDNVDIESNTITGSVANNDDGILLLSASGGYIYGNTISGFFDAAIEQNGSSSGLYIQANTWTNIGNAGFFCPSSQFSVCDINNANIATNSLSGTGSPALIKIYGYNGSGSLTNTSILSNTSGNGGASVLSTTSSPIQMATVSGNVIGYNTFGSNVDFQNTAGFTDIGSNYCTSAYLTAITCH